MSEKERIFKNKVSTHANSGYPIERIAIDIFGELPTTERGNKYIMVTADYFTKWTECFAMCYVEAQTVARILVEEVITRFGILNKIHSDQGRQFESHLFKEMCKLLHHPAFGGMVQRFNKTLATMISAFVTENQTNWDEQLPFLLMAYRSSVHETTQYTPNMLMLGRETSTHLDILYEMPSFHQITMSGN
jgi:hypothetical protein